MHPFAARSRSLLGLYRPAPSPLAPIFPQQVGGQKSDDARVYIYARSFRFDVIIVNQTSRHDGALLLALPTCLAAYNRLKASKLSALQLRLVTY